MRIPPIFLSCAFACFVAAAAENPEQDKSRYTLFDPTPTRLMRPLSSDEADKVVGPYTVDAGHFQVESDLVNYWNAFTDHFAGNANISESANALSWAPRFKVGLCNQADFEVQAGYFTGASRLSVGGTTLASESESKFLPVQPKVKINLWGNDGGLTALSIAPFLSIPTDGSADVTGGIGVPFAVQLPEDFTLKIYSEIFWAENSFEAISKEFSNDASITKALTSRLSVFADISTQVSTAPGTDWFGYAGGGLYYIFGRDFQLYAGLRLGINPSAYDYNPYLGFTWRY